MNYLDIAPPMAPGTQKKKKGNFFSRFLKKDVEEVRMTEDSMNLDEIRRKAGIDEPAPITREESELAVPEPSNIEEVAFREPQPATEPVPELSEIVNESEPVDQEPPAEAVPEIEEESAPQLIEEVINDSLEPPRFDVEEELPPVEDIKSVEKELDALEQEHDEWMHANDEQEDTSEAMTEIEAPMSDLATADEEAPVTSSEWSESETTSPDTQESSSWTDDAVSETSELTVDSEVPESTQEPEEQIPAHVAVDAALAPIAKKHAAFDKELEKVAKEIRADIPDWSYQRKEVKPDQYFTLKNGQEISSFKDLLDALSFIDDETFQHHVTEDRNDFAEWIQHILEEEKLAERIRNKTAREELLKILRTHERKIWKSLEKKTQKLQNTSKTQQKASTKMKKLEKKLEKLQGELEEKSATLKELRGKHATKIKQHVDAHIADGIDEERTEMRLDKELLDKKEIALTELDTNNTSRQEALDEAEKQLAKDRQALDDERTTFEQERTEAQELLSQGVDIRAERETAEQKMTEAEAMLKKNETVLRETTKQKGITQRAQERLKEQKNTFAESKKGFMNTKKEVTARERALTKAEAEAEKRVTKADEWHTQVLRERKELQDEKKQSLAEIASERKEIKSMVTEVKKKTQEYEELVSQHEANIQRNEEILSETETLRDDIRQRQDALGSQSMQEYLRTKVDSTVTGSITSDITPVEEISNLHLYKLIDQCKNALGRNELSKARHAYNQLRDEFSQSKLSSHEKSVLYNSIRELYDDIHLAMLN